MYTTIKDKRVPIWEQEKVKNWIWTAVVILTSLVILSTLYIHFHVENCQQWYVALKEQRPDADLMITSPDVKIREIICKKHHDICYYILDADYGSLSQLRRLQIEPQYHTVLCGALIDEKDKPIPDQMWMTYVRLVMHAPYIFNIFKSGQRSRVLQIGLGGGVSGAFLEWLPEKHDITTVELEPTVIHIAKKWYNVPFTDRHHIIEGDGFHYVKERAESESKFDFAFVDTSYDDDFHLMMSPVAIFSRDEFASNLRKQMNSTGCAVTVNTYTHHKELEKLLDAEKFRHDMLHVYRKHFESCFFVETGSNNILFCSCKNVGEITQLGFDKLFQAIPPEIKSRIRCKYLVRSDW